MKLTKEQYKEVLTVFRDYSYWMYNTEDGIKEFKNFSVNHAGLWFSLNVLPNGKVKAFLNEHGLEAIYDIQVTVTPISEKSICNHAFQARIDETNATGDYLRYFEELRVFVMSFFQRNIAFTFISRMAEETIDRIAEDLQRVKI